MHFGVSSLKDEQKSAQIFRPIFLNERYLYMGLAYQASPVRQNYVQPFCLDCV